MNKLTNIRQTLAEKPYILAVIISVLLILWMVSGLAKEPTAPAEKNKHEIPTPKVQVETRYASNIHDVIEVYGRTEPNRITTLKAESAGKIAKVLAERGSVVSKGQIIAELELNDLPAQLAYSRALLIQRKIEHDGSKSLNADGYQGKAQLAQTFANLESVKATIKKLEIIIAHSVIRAPFDGVLNTRYVEEGDYVKSADEIAMIADLNPLIVRAFVTENQISHVNVGQTAAVNLLNREEIFGKIRYIASVADEKTNTFKVEVAIDNPANKLVAGISSEITIALEEVAAIKISPALLALDEKGNIGVKTVENNKVHFTPINIMKSESDGIWLSGLGQQADIITLGQGFVRAGDTVEAIFKMSAAKVATTEVE
jgi:multidrug efflux system membrane fusion protein